ncbi:MAG: glycosyltransferase family 1 protein [bacterium]|nr:glycosyltransferase family 1 protein [bacterium]
MRIGIDARMIGQTGIGRYITNLVLELAKLDSKTEYKIFVRHPRDLPLKAKNFTPIVANIPWYSLQEQIKLTRLFQKADIELLHVPHFNVPFFYNGRFIVTIHDLTHTRVNLKRATTLAPWLYQAKRLAYMRVLNHALGNSQHIITVTNAVKNEILSMYKIPSKKILVTPEAVAASFGMKRHPRLLNDPYFFYVGNAHPHKNLERLVEAFLSISEKERKGHKLVLAGREHYFWERLKQEIKARPGFENVVFQGSVSDLELEAWYQHATAFVFPSLAEGFGLPVLEAMKCGTPVVISRIPALNEIGGDLPTFFDPKSVEDIAQGLRKALGMTEKERSVWSKKAIAHAKTFSWSKMATQTLDLYRSLVSGQRDQERG